METMRGVAIRGKGLALAAMCTPTATAAGVSASWLGRLGGDVEVNGAEATDLFFSEIEVELFEQLAEISDEIAHDDPKTCESHPQTIAVGRKFDIHDHEPTGGLEYAVQLGHCPMPIGVAAERHRIDDAVESIRLVRQRLDRALAKPGLDIAPIQVFVRDHYHLLVVVDSIRIEVTCVLGQQVAGAKRDLEDARTLYMGQRLLKPSLPDWDIGILGCKNTNLTANY